MDWIKRKADSVTAGIQEAIRDDALRRELMFQWLNILLALVSFFMTVVNVFTKEYTLMVSTFLFSVGCIGNLVLSRRGKRAKSAAYVLFILETVALLAFFLISGIPNGFSALWMCLIPSFSLLIFGRKAGTRYSIFTFLMLLFFFWLPFGRNLLQYHYTSEFMLRFPFFYAACFLLALFVEVIRAQTQKQLLESEQKYLYLSRHDALTGLYNRYGFNDIVDREYRDPKPGKVAVMILDIDDFKCINDRYGHNNGDVVLRGIADILRDAFCHETHFCRWGGEEFTAFLHCGHDYAGAAERLRRRVEEAEFRSGDLRMKVTVSVGLCIAGSMEETTIAKLVNQADQCLYTAKGKGKNQVSYIELP